MDYDQFMEKAKEIANKFFGENNWTVSDSFNCKPDFRMDFSTEWCEGGIEFVGNEWSVEFTHMSNLQEFSKLGGLK